MSKKNKFPLVRNSDIIFLQRITEMYESFTLFTFNSQWCDFSQKDSYITSDRHHTKKLCHCLLFTLCIPTHTHNLFSDSKICTVKRVCNMSMCVHTFTHLTSSQRFNKKNYPSKFVFIVIVRSMYELQKLIS